MTNESTESLVEKLRILAGEQESPCVAQDLHNVADRLERLYFGVIPGSKLAERYQAQAKKLAGCRRGLRQLQRAHLAQNGMVQRLLCRRVMTAPDLRSQIAVLISQRIALAKLACESPQFFNPIEIWNAQALRDRVLAEAGVEVPK